MNFKTFIIIAALSMGVFSFAQERIFFQDFETLAEGKGIKSKEMGAFNFWGKAKWKIINEDDNNFTRSNKIQGVALVKVIKLKADKNYKWKLKVRPGGENSSRGNLVFSVISGPKEDRYEYLKQTVKNIESNKWSVHEFNFKVIPGREKVTLSLYRWAEGEVVDVDDFELIAQ